jgi:hypothetical protein
MDVARCRFGFMAMMRGLLGGSLRTADGRFVSNTELRGEGVGLDYRPSPRQLRRSSP